MKQISNSYYVIVYDNGMYQGSVTEYDPIRMESYTHLDFVEFGVENMIKCKSLEEAKRRLVRNHSHIELVTEHVSIEKV